MSHERKKLGIQGAVKIPDSNFFLVPGSLWNEWKTVIHGEPDCDEFETEILRDASGVIVPNEKGEEQEVFRRRRLSNPKDVSYYREQGIRVFKSFKHLNSAKAESGALYVGSDGLIYDPSGDTWMENATHEGVRELGGIFVNDTYICLLYTSPSPRD